MKRTQKILSSLLPIITFGCIIAVWAVAAAAVGSEYVLPSVSLTFSALVELFCDGSFYLSYALTVLRVVVAFILSFALAFGGAFLAKRYSAAEKIINPIISVLRCLPTVAVVLLLMFWTSSQVAPVIVTMLVVLPVLYTNLRAALDTVDEDVVQMCSLFGVDKKKVFYKVKLPAILPPVTLAVGSGLSLNLKLMVAAEVLAATANSIGAKLAFSNYNLQVATMIALVVVTVVTGVIIESVFGYLSKKVVKGK